MPAIWIWDETRGYATAGVSVYMFKGDSAEGGCQVRRGSHFGRAKEIVARRIARDSVRQRLS
jgi:hypothetical protein